jgi:hypothetical protein
MPTKSALLLFLTMSFFLIVPTAQAKSIAITGSSAVSALDWENYVTGGPLSITTVTPSGPEIVGIVTPGSVVHFQLSVPFVSTLQGVLGNNATLGNQTTDMMTGGLLFSGTFTAPTNANYSTVTFPVAMIGNVVAFQDLNGLKGPALFALNFKGSGTMTLTIDQFQGQDLILVASANYSGTATTVPEPSSFLLLGSGLAGIVIIRRKLLRLS